MPAPTCHGQGSDDPCLETDSALVALAISAIALGTVAAPLTIWARAGKCAATEKGTGRIPPRVHCQLPAAPAQDDGVAESGQRGAG